MLTTFAVSPRSLHSRSRQAIHTTLRHASDVSMAHIVGFRCAGYPFEIQTGASFAGALYSPILMRGSEQKTHSSAAKRFWPKAKLSVEWAVFTGVWKQAKSRGQRNSIAFLSSTGMYALRLS